MSLVGSVLRLTSAAAATALLAAVPALAAAQDSVDAVWVPKHIEFIYQGFTTHYSCDGLQEQIRGMLQKLGARDLEVRQMACTRLEGPTPFPGVRVTMSVLVPASSAQASKAKSASPPVQAQWKEVVLMPSNASYEDQGNCELIEQFKRTFLPLFTTRKVDYGSTCVPHELTLGTHLSAQVLMPPPKVARSGQP
ncbi:MAG TPA: hypothetical protein VMU52_08550 [Steroidobacteraceae bacterium]|nr:hypothetical protein [Steroidobacteraceae bacterium]